MIDPKNDLLSHYLRDRAEEIAADPAADGPWEAGLAALGDVRGDEAAVREALEARDRAALEAILAEWRDGTRRLPAHDRDLLKRALRAFKKRLKSTRLDSESTVGGGPTSSGMQSSITGVRPPHLFTPAIWRELVFRGRLRDAGHGVLELPPGGLG